MCSGQDLISGTCKNIQLEKVGGWIYSITGDVKCSTEVDKQNNWPTNNNTITDSLLTRHYIYGLGEIT